jgi:hypothetical protein
MTYPVAFSSLSLPNSLYNQAETGREVKEMARNGWINAACGEKFIYPPQTIT